MSEGGKQRNSEENTSSTSVKAGSTGLSPPGSGNSVDEREPALQPLSRTETTVDGGGDRHTLAPHRIPATAKETILWS